MHERLVGIFGEALVRRRKSLMKESGWR
jgi:hypothetical protein